MAGSRLVQASLRCYPQRWRRRRGEEAAELARLLIRDGTPARSIAWSYFKGAAGARLVPSPRRRLGATVGALLAVAGSLGISLALLSSSAPANAVTGPCSGAAAAAGTAGPGPVPDGHRDTAGGTARSPASIAGRITTGKPANSSAVSGHGQRC